jgi:HEPN domain-containing protein
MTPALQEFIKKWLSKAETDLRSAQRLLEIEPPIPDTACFHCQQSIEKNLKAYLAYNGVDIQRTHNIVFLLSKCAEHDSIFRNIDPKNIDIYAVHARYPEYDEEVGIVESKEHYALARRVSQLVCERIKFDT